MNLSDIDSAVRKVREGDLEAYRDVIALSETKVRIVLAAILPEPAMVEDLLQEVFTNAYFKLGDYQSGSDFFSWIKEIARNLALNERRRWVRRHAATRRFRAQVEEGLERRLHDLTRRVEGAAVPAIRECVERLEEKARQVIEAYYWQGRSGAAIAKALGHTTDWVWVILYRARTFLARCLQGKGVFHGP